MKRVAVVGGGITGLAAAHRLACQGFEVALFESSDRVGGAIRTLREEGFCYEAGPNTLLVSPAVQSWISELGIEDDVVQAQPGAKNRYVVKGGQLVPVPLSPPALLRSKLLSVRGKWSLLRDLTLKPVQREQDISAAEFFRLHFGSEALDYGADPFIRGVYAGDPERLSLRHAFPTLWELERSSGSILRGQLRAARERRRTAPPLPRRRIISFSQGLQHLPDSAARQLGQRIRTHSRVTALERIPTGWLLHGQNSVPHAFDAVLLALPAPALAALQLPHTEAALAPLATLPHVSLVTLFLGFPPAGLRHPLDGFGALAPRREGRDILGVLFSSTLFPDRAPPSAQAVTLFLGGSHDPQAVHDDDERLFQRALRELDSLLGVNAPPIFQRLTRWPKAIPQYELGFDNFLQVMDACEQAHPGLFIAGQCRNGISLPQCAEAGFSAADRIRSHLLG